MLQFSKKNLIGIYVKLNIISNPIDAIYFFFVLINYKKIHIVCIKGMQILQYLLKKIKQLYIFLILSKNNFIIYPKLKL